jgi:hypothetical protein
MHATQTAWWDPVTGHYSSSSLSHARTKHDLGLRAHASASSRAVALSSPSRNDHVLCTGTVTSWLRLGIDRQLGCGAGYKSVVCAAHLAFGARPSTSGTRLRSDFGGQIGASFVFASIERRKKGRERGLDRPHRAHIEVRGRHRERI